MEPTEIHQDRQLVIKAFLDRLREMKYAEQIDLISSLGGFFAATSEGRTEESEEWVTTITELFVDPPAGIVYLDLDNPKWLDEVFLAQKEQSAISAAKMMLWKRSILSLSEAKALARDPEFARLMEEAANDLKDGKGTVRPAGTFPSTDGKSVEDRGQ